jgi:hypothetical protein
LLPPGRKATLIGIEEGARTGGNTEARRHGDRRGRDGKEKGDGCEGGLSVDSVALCFYFPDGGADGGNTEAQRHGDRKGKEIGEDREIEG